MNPIIEVKNLVKKYPNINAVDNTSFTVEQGICFGLLGPNGAGKTTTIEMMEGIIQPNSGQILYKGSTLGKQFKQEAGIQFQSTALQDYLSVYDNLKLFKSFYEKTLPIEQLVEICSLQSFVNQDARKLSGGQRQRLLLAIALVNDPEIIFLDEPTTGLDPQARRNFWDLINRIKSENKTILLTTHYMEEAYLLCDQIAIMDHGKIITNGTPTALLAEHFGDSILEIPKKDFAIAKEKFPIEILEKTESIEISTKAIDKTIETLITYNISLENLRIRPRTLEDLFLELTGKELRS